MLETLARYAIKVLPDSAAGAVVRAVATRTQPLPVRPLEQQAIAQATRLHYGAGKNVAYAWGKGPRVLFVHGWGGRAAQMAPLALHVAKLGFLSVAIDVTGHGESPTRRATWTYFLKDIAEAAESLGEELYAVVGHSAGGVTAMAARKLKSVRAQRYVCICAPSHPFPPIVTIQRRLNPRPSVLAQYKEYIAAQFETTWEKLQRGSSYAGAGAELLLCYDEMDKFVPHGEGDRIRSLCPGATLRKTNAYGHAKILASPELAQAVGEFLERERTSAGSKGRQSEHLKLVL